MSDVYELAEEWARNNAVAGAGDVIAAFVAGYNAAITCGRGGDERA